MNSSPVRRHSNLFLSVYAIVGLVVFWGFIQTPSELENQFLLGLSLKRLAVGSIFAFVLLLNIGTVLWLSLESGQKKADLEHRIFEWAARHVTWVMMVVYAFCLVTGLSLLVVSHPFENIPILDAFRTLLVRPVLWSFLLNLFVLVLFRASFKDELKTNKVNVVLERYLPIMGLFVLTYLLYQHLMIWAASSDRSIYSYWNLLADAFLKGRIYLIDPPQTIDLTLAQGKWYVPMPPLPAILMMPLAYFVGGENIDTRYFSIFFSSINVVIMYLILRQFSGRRWIGLSSTGILLLVVLFAIGTPHLWVGIRGRAWFVSQITTVTFSGLSVFAALRKWSPWVVGVFLGMAVVSRPNAVMIWLFAFAIAMQIIKEEQGTVGFTQLVNWSIRSVVPVVAAIGCLLIYNQVRFGNFLDFGYITINGNPVIVENAQKYGVFSLHFIPINLKVMFLNTPALDPGGRWPILPSSVGMSVFLTTPALIYLFHHYERQWWIIGAWLSVFLNFLLLVLYHNTGANQFGYRYILDAIVPVVVLLAVALGRKMPWHFLLFLLLSIGINIYGTYWFINR